MLIFIDDLSVIHFLFLFRYTEGLQESIPAAMGAWNPP